MNIFESIIMALQSVRANKLRAFLTLISVAVGVFTIVAVGSLVDAIEGTVQGEIESLGSTNYYITRMPQIQIGNNEWRKYRKRKNITYSQYKDFKKKLTSTDMVCCESTSGGKIVEFGSNKSDPDVTLIGCDYHFFGISNLIVERGRILMESDISSNRNVAVIGNDVVVKVFPNTDPIGQEIKIRNKKFVVIGVLETKGALLGNSQDNRVIIPITPFLKYYAEPWDESVDISVKTYKYEELTASIDESIGIMRSLRKCEPWEDNSFEIATNEALLDQFGDLTGYLNYFGIIAGGFALLAAGVGIMNIMLVSVKERTREIGIRKAVGAKKYWIVFQFLVEAITLCNLGSIAGIFFGVSLAALIGSLMNLDLVISINWIAFSLTVCTLIGIVFGAYPAYKAAQLDPIDALRYE
jgi:putative ABC transport system permease protein